ncbi:MAG: Selenoprotein O and cysteine-containing homologs [uncultured Sulfurovum sp.]|uniref:Protein nucleotidyltransferase YdiU n=1 Tax=uncultured Sulfurovum sp. TaxID=269237 RepID=A0A6S6S7X5_9BACT|nr:MAG: Selenoprotein O and cysteine-containing homologs [uncultured Sulfurovum sp.]
MKLNELIVTNPYLNLPSACYDKSVATPLTNPHLIHANTNVAKVLNIDTEEIETDTFVNLLNSEYSLEGSDIFSMCYAGHQFGHFVPRLGDGRVINIGTIGTYHLQLKGAGETLYSRHGDGRAVLRSSIREYLLSEAMQALSIPTTLCLGLIGSEHDVRRESIEKAAIVCRVSTSWVRFGTFEYFASQGMKDELKALADYVIEESFAHISGKEDKYTRLFNDVVVITARLMAQWMSVGFNHGVMNTDNMSIAGLTIDYGPYAFLDDFKHDYVCNHTDEQGRYSFENQPSVAKWNLERLMMALTPLTTIDKMQKALMMYDKIYTRYFHYYMCKKLGFEGTMEGDPELIDDMFDMLELLHVDYTLFMRTLSHYEGEREALLSTGLYHEPMNLWLDRYDTRTENLDKIERKKQMLTSNPKYVLKNYMLEEAIDAAESGDYSMVDDLFTIAKKPFDEHVTFERWSKATPQEFKNQRLSCSS